MAIVICPECNKKISTTTTKCIHCGAKIKFCPDCDSPLLENDEKCLECGYKFITADKKENIVDKAEAVAKSKDINALDADDSKEEQKNKEDVLMLKELLKTWKEKEKYSNFEKGAINKVFTALSVTKWIFLAIVLICLLSKLFFSTQLLGVGLLTVMIVLASLFEIASVIRVGVESYMLTSAEKSFLSHADEVFGLEKAFEHDKVYIEKYMKEYETNGQILISLAFAIKAEFYENNKGYQIFRNIATVAHKLLSSSGIWIIAVMAIIAIQMSYFTVASFFVLLPLIISFAVIEFITFILKKISKPILASSRKKWLEKNAPASFIFAEKIISADDIGFIFNEID